MLTRNSVYMPNVSHAWPRTRETIPGTRSPFRRLDTSNRHGKSPAKIGTAMTPVKPSTLVNDARSVSTSHSAIRIMPATGGLDAAYPAMLAGGRLAPAGHDGGQRRHGSGSYRFDCPPARRRDRRGFAADSAFGSHPARPIRRHRPG